jgi:prepilin-type N-terminal cleavage/methylation domain-containing protein
VKKAFTMLELVFVIVVVGILAATLLPRMSSSNLEIAAQRLLNDIRYTQHLAFIDDKFDPNDPDWFKQRWQIIFSKQANSDNKWAYTIFADTLGVHSGKPNFSEIAKNPLDNTRVLSGGYNDGSSKLDIRNKNSFRGTKACNLGISYGITNVIFSSSCSIGSSKRIAFDHMGRPLRSDLSQYTSPYSKNGSIRILEQTCIITLVDNSDANVSIAIEPETGYVHIVQN